uniref:Uncharacterized protein n=1 Tax=Callithrix jacchus TaxID=9483 RepID=A0A8I3VXD3_CALJA
MHMYLPRFHTRPGSFWMGTPLESRLFLLLRSCGISLCHPGWSGMISVHCNLCLLSSSDDSPVSASRATGVTDACHNNWLIFIFLVETRFHHVDQAGLELLTSGNLSAFAPQSAGITGVSQPEKGFSESKN